MLKSVVSVKSSRTIRLSWNYLGLILSTVILSISLAACGSETPTGDVRTLDTTIPPGATTTSAEVAATPAVTTAGATVAATTAAPETTPATVTPLPATTTAAIAGQQAAATTALATTAGVTSADQLESNTVVEVVNKVSPAVVTVYNKSKYNPTTRRVIPNQPTPGADSQNSADGLVVQGIGSGVIISNDGYIVTNNHVVDGQDGLAVALNDGKTTLNAKLVGRDITGDLAVLKIDGPVPAFAKFAAKAEVGETVIAIGAALGNFRNSVSKGIVSGLNRTLPSDNGVYIQTDAAINHGNSGGPLLNLKGEIVGINTAVLRSTGSTTRSQNGAYDVAEGLGFAIPSNVVKFVSDQLISKGSVTRSYFGISYQMITPAEAGTLSVNGRAFPLVEGAWINSSNGASGILKGGPAEKAGLKDNDVITAIDGQPLNDNNPLVNVILGHKPGDTIKLTVQRGDQVLTLDLTLGERPSDT
jgi:2-alkenal reductase